MTYTELPDCGDKYSPLLPPDWKKLIGKRLEEIAAFQWKAANEHIINDLGKIAPNR